jgi:uncharacterized membrane protein YhaH (DUF805 family)
MRANRLGFWSSAATLAIGVAYAVVLAAGFVRHGLREPITDPILAIMELLTLLSAPPVVVLMAAVCDRAGPDGKVYGLAALAFATLFAGTTSVVHFVELTATRQSGGGGIVWPSATYAAELLAWDVFLGLSLVFAAPSFAGEREASVRRGLFGCGVLCLLGVLGPAVGNMRLQLVGVLGYAVVLPLVALLLMRLFERERRSNEQAGCHAPRVPGQLIAKTSNSAPKTSSP